MDHGQGMGGGLGGVVGSGNGVGGGSGGGGGMPMAAQVGWLSLSEQKFNR